MIKKALFGLVILGALFAGSCSKKDNDKTTPGKSWTFNGEHNNTATATREYDQYITFEAANGSYLRFFFYDGLPVKDGDYKIVMIPDMDSETVFLELRQNYPVVVGLSDSENKTLKVTVSGGKLHLSCTDITLLTTDDTNDKEGTERFSVDISE